MCFLCQEKPGLLQILACSDSGLHQIQNNGSMSLQSRVQAPHVVEFLSGRGRKTGPLTSHIAKFFQMAMILILHVSMTSLILQSPLRLGQDFACGYIFVSAWLWLPVLHIPKSNFLLSVSYSTTVIWNRIECKKSWYLRKKNWKLIIWYWARPGLHCCWDLIRQSVRVFFTLKIYGFLLVLSLAPYSWNPNNWSIIWSYAISTLNAKMKLCVRGVLEMNNHEVLEIKQNK